MENKEKTFVSAVVYVHNAEKRIEDFMEMLLKVFKNHFEHSEVICVNDCSDDNSIEIIRKITKDDKSVNVSVLNMSYFHGLELAMNAGVDLSIGDFVFEFDTTMTDYKPEQIMQVYSRALQGYDIVSAVSDRKEKFSSRLFYSAFDRFSHLTYHMHTESFRILSRRVINRVTSMNKAVPYRKAIYAGCGLKTEILTYHIVQTYNDKMDKKEKRYRSTLAVDSLILFTELGYQFSIFMTGFMMFMSIFMSFYSIATYIVAHPVEGWTTTILFLSITFFGLFGILTIVIKYLQLLIELVFRRKRYSFESVEKLTK